MTYEIIKNCPPHRELRGQYPFDQMEVGDAFDAPRNMGVGAKGGCRRQSSITNSANSWAKNRNSTAKFSVNIIDEKTVRCRRWK